MTVSDPAPTSAWAEALERAEPDAVTACDELALWSAPFGQALLEAVRLLPGQVALDIGCGTGFPALELAARLGDRGRVVGLDPAVPMLERARAKAAIRGVQNATFVEGVAERLPFADEHFDLVVSNNGLNNVADPAQALAECRRVSQPMAQLVMTSNLPRTFELFYDYWEGLLEETGQADVIPRLRAHRETKRKPANAWIILLESAGFRVKAARELTFRWSFLDGSALFRHPSIRLGFLPPWIEVLGAERSRDFLPFLEGRLNRLALERGGLHLEVPFVCISAERG